MYGLFQIGAGSPGSLGGQLQPPPVHAFTAPLDQPAASWPEYPPGIPNTGIQPQMVFTSTAGNAPCVKSSSMMPPQLITVETTSQGPAHVHGGIPGPKVGPHQIPTPKVFGPRLIDSKNPAVSGKAAGSALNVQESTPLSTLHAFPKGEGYIGQASVVPKPAPERPAEHAMGPAMLEEIDEFQSAGSLPAPALMQNRRMYAEQESMKVLPAAWQHQVPEAFEAQFADGQQHRADASDPLANAQGPPRKTLLAEGERQAAPLAEYHLAAPAVAGATVLQLVSQSGLQIGDFLLIEQGTIHEELVLVVGFGSVILGVPLRHTHAAGAPVVLSRSYQPGTPSRLPTCAVKQHDTSLRRKTSLRRAACQMMMHRPSMASRTTKPGRKPKGSINRRDTAEKAGRHFAQLCGHCLLRRWSHRPSGNLTSSTAPLYVKGGRWMPLKKSSWQNSEVLLPSANRLRHM